MTIFACGGPPPAGEAPAPVEPVPEVAPAAVDTLPAAEEAAPAEAPEPPDTRSWAQRTLDSLTLREKVGQMMMPWVIGDFAPEGSPSHERIMGLIRDQQIGGVIMSVGQPTEVAAKINDLQRHATIPLLVAADLETGAGFRMWGAVYMPGTIELGGATNFPTLMAVGATGDASLAYRMGAITGEEARAVGVHVPFAPVLDVNNNPDNPIINVRSFGEDPDEVARLGTAFVRGMQEHGAIATGKHFPGHGDTGTDSHLSLPTIDVTRARMDTVELKPFQAAIDAGIGGIMTAHITVPALNGGNGTPATLSRPVLTDLLRGEMGFDGLIFTDAMDMARDLRPPGLRRGGGARGRGGRGRHPHALVRGGRDAGDRRRGAQRAYPRVAHRRDRPAAARHEGVARPEREPRGGSGPDPRDRGHPRAHRRRRRDRPPLHHAHPERQGPPPAQGHPQRERAVDHLSACFGRPGGPLLQPTPAPDLPAPRDGRPRPRRQRRRSTTASCARRAGRRW